MPFSSMEEETKRIMLSYLLLFFQSLDEKDVKAAAKTAEKAEKKKKDEDESGLEKCLAKKKLEVDICRTDEIVNT